MLEVAKNSVLVQNDDGTSDLLPLNGYNRLRFVHLDGKPVKYSAKDTEHEASIEEIEKGSFSCSLDGAKLHIDNAEAVAQAILAQIEKGTLNVYVALWKLCDYLNNASVGLKIQPAWYRVGVEDGSFNLPVGTLLRKIESASMNGGTLEKVIYELAQGRPSDNDNPQQRVRVSVMGKDESGQSWLRMSHRNTKRGQWRNAICGCSELSRTRRPS